MVGVYKRDGREKRTRYTHAAPHVFVLARVVVESNHVHALPPQRRRVGHGPVCHLALRNGRVPGALLQRVEALVAVYVLAPVAAHVDAACARLPVIVQQGNLAASVGKIWRVEQLLVVLGGGVDPNEGVVLVFAGRGVADVFDAEVDGPVSGVPVWGLEAGDGEFTTCVFVVPAAWNSACWCGGVGGVCRVSLVLGVDGESGKRDGEYVFQHVERLVNSERKKERLKG